MTALTNRDKSNKLDRVPVSGLRDILTVEGKDPKYHYHWVVDTDERGGRIMKFKRGGYDLVPASDVEIGQDSVYKSKQDGSLVRMPTGGGKHSYLMKIKQEWYEQDQKAAQEAIAETEQSMTRPDTAEGGQYGSIKIET